MLTKTWNEMRKIDVRPHCDSRDGYLYLNWARCIAILHEQGAEVVHFEPIQNPKTGGSLYESETVFKDKNGNTNRNYETRIRVTIDDKIYEFHSPVNNGTNPVKDNSMSQQRVWNSMTRAFVKCVAINTGLGFDLWLKEEEQTLQHPPLFEDGKASLPELSTIRKKCDANGVNLPLWLKRHGIAKLDDLTANQAGYMLRVLNEKFGD